MVLGCLLSRKLTWKPIKGPIKTSVLLKGAIWVSIFIWGSVGVYGKGLMVYGQGDLEKGFVLPCHTKVPVAILMNLLASPLILRFRV